MSTSRSSSSNLTETTDLRTTNTINAGIGGDIEDSFVVSGNYGDTALTSVVDNSTYDFEDNADNSFYANLEDNSDRSVVDNTNNSIDNRVITDGGAFDLVGRLIDTLGESQSKTLDAANNLAARSLDGAMSIKAGQTITEPANQTMRELAKTGTVIAGIAAVAFVGSKFLGK